MLTQLSKFLKLLSDKERRHFYLLIVMVLFMAIIDALGVASVMPFMAVLANPQIIETNYFLGLLYDLSNSSSTKEFLFILGVLVFLILIFSLIFKSVTTYFQVKFAMMCEYTIGKAFVKKYINQPYEWFLSKDSSNLGKNVLSEVQNIILNVVMPFMVIFSQLAVAVSILVLLIVIDPFLSLSIFIVLSLLYLFVFKLMSRRLVLLGEERLQANETRFKAIIEMFSAAKEIKVGGHEKICTSRFSESAKKYANGQSIAEIISVLPRFIFEGIAFGGMLLVTLYLMVIKGDFTTSIPILALYAFAGYRLLPALQFIYRAISQIKFAEKSLNSLYEDYINLNFKKSKTSSKEVIKTDKIELQNVYYKYDNQDNYIIKNISLEILKKNVVAFVGKTGSGKTTIVDLILGLLKPSRGSLTVGEKKINIDNVGKWQKKIGYVPQNIYLSNDTIKNNIAFGINESDIDLDQIKKVSNIAYLDEFILNQEKGFDTEIGERGVRLSGGQRQRIGIARALYNKPDVLILDEATSALDTLTEKNIMNSIHKLKKNLTIILIAHRLSTVKKCDQIYLIEKGEIIARGSFDELSRDNETFNSMSL